MHHNMILSASGWRKVFTESGKEEDFTRSIGKPNTLISVLIGETFSEYLLEMGKTGKPVVIVGQDTRPTGNEIAKAIIKALVYSGIDVHYLGIAAAPEIMAYAKTADAFIYISASHNPVGHNGIKFGLSDGGVLSAEESRKLIAAFERKCEIYENEAHAWEILSCVSDSSLAPLYDASRRYKEESLRTYNSFIREVITGSADAGEQELVFSRLRNSLQDRPLTVVVDMNGSARTCSIDRDLLESLGIKFAAFNDTPGKIAHAIIPEPENLADCAFKMKLLQRGGDTNAILGYMPDCDGDRGNIVFWSDRNQEEGEENPARPIPAQEVFALCVMAESAFSIWKDENLGHGGLLQTILAMQEPKAVAVNGPTSMRIDEICGSLGMQLFRAEVGEANVVQLAQKKREAGYKVRILGEGSNGGNITYPSRVRDPLATLFAIIKLLLLRDTKDKNGNVKKGLFHIWCAKSGQEYRYHDDFTLSDILESLPVYTTTGVSESRAILQVATKDKGLLKERFKQLFEEEWALRKDEIEAIYGFTSYEADTTNGTEEQKNTSNWNNGTGGLKIRFQDRQGETKAFIWMRPSGTEPVFRVMCDIRGDEPSAERSLLRWEVSLIRKADAIETDAAS